MNKYRRNGAEARIAIKISNESFFSPEIIFGSKMNGGGWSRSEDKRFESALVRYPDGTPDRWYFIAQELPGRSPREVYEHYVALVHDINAIESGLVDLPDYNDVECEGASGGGDRISGGREQRRRGEPWTEDEHRRFLEGMAKCGKGDWKGISRLYVVTRTPTQVASHAQKYFLRQQNGSRRQSKRKSIHDITRP